MKQYIKTYFIGALLMLGMLSACKEETDLNLGEGSVQLNVQVSDDVTVVSRAVSDDVYNSMQTRIYNSKGLIRYYDAQDPAPGILNLASGDYHIFVLAGDSVAAAFDTPYYTGSSDFTVRNGELTTANVVCTIANTLATVAFAPELSEVVTDCQVKIFTTRGELLFTEENLGAVGYYMLSSKETDLGWSFEGKNTDGKSYTQSGVIENVARATKYAFTFNFNAESAATGGAFIDVKVDETTVDVSHEVVFNQRPQIVGNKFALDKPLYFETNGGNEVGVWVNASSQLKSVAISNDKFNNGLGFSTNTIDFMLAANEIITEFEGKGIRCQYTYEEDKDISNAKIILSENFIQSLPAAEYLFTVKAIDVNDKENTQTFTVVISDATVVVDLPARASIWATKATLAGTLMKETAETLSFQYREVGTSAWSSVPATLSGTSLTAEVTGLNPGTKYEYQAVAGTTASATTATFTTEAASVLPNSSFENWHTPNKAMVVYAEGEEMFWDTGNHGSATMNKNVTSPDETYAHSGKYSAKLQSQFVGIGSIGKFAAGNIFIGQYLRTDGTDGVLNFGRPFTSRPAKLHGYIKYVPGTVEYSSTDELPTGSTDIGNIYIALGDWDAPVEIRTKSSDQKLFDKNDANIIAYGELNLTETKEGADGGLTEFEIVLDYRSMTRIPTYIVLTASASKYGDYFSGGASTMWLDDLELIYE